MKTTPFLAPTVGQVATPARPVSPLSRAQWEALHAKAEAAHAALSDLSHALLMQAAQLNNAPLPGDSVLVQKLIDEAKRTQDAQSAFLPAYFYACQPEWTGGDSSDPANHVLREPHLTDRRLTVHA